jgi:Putative addiction module component
MTDELRLAALSLPAAERAELAYALLESLDEEDAQPDAPGAWLDELDRGEEADRRRAGPAGS